MPPPPQVSLSLACDGPVLLDEERGGSWANGLGDPHMVSVLPPARLRPRSPAMPDDSASASPPVLLWGCMGASNSGRTKVVWTGLLARGGSQRRDQGLLLAAACIKTASP